MLSTCHSFYFYTKNVDPHCILQNSNSSWITISFQSSMMFTLLDLKSRTWNRAWSYCNVTRRQNQSWRKFPIWCKITNQPTIKTWWAHSVNFVFSCNLCTVDDSALCGFILVCVDRTAFLADQFVFTQLDVFRGCIMHLCNSSNFWKR